MEKSETYSSRVACEYDNLKKLFEAGAPEQVKLLDNVFRRAAHILVEIEDMEEIIMKCGGRVIIHPKEPMRQKELPVSKVLERARASYANYMFRLSRALGGGADDTEDVGLSEFE